MTDSAPDPRRGRRQLLLIALVFFLPIALAAALALSGWVPAARSHGEPIVPQESFAALPVRLADGKDWPWRAATPQYTLLALPGPGCGAACVGKLDLLHRAQVGLTNGSDKLRLLYLGVPPTLARAAPVMQAWAVGATRAPQLLRFVPTQPDSVAAILVAADGTAIVRYPPTVSAAAINKDLRRLFK